MRIAMRLFAVGLLCAGCLVTAPVTVTAAEATKVIFRTDFKVNGYVGPFALAQERGYYRAAGLDVELGQGQGSATTIQTVATGSDTFGIADSATVLLGVSAQNIPVKILSVYLQTGTSGLIYLPTSGFDGKIASLKGRPVVSSAGAGDLTLLEPALATASMTNKDVDLRLVDFNARVPVFLQTPTAVLTGFASGDFLRVQARAPSVLYKPYADYGVIAYSTGLIVGNQFMSKNPDKVRAFVEASAKGWDDAARDPEAAITALLKIFPDQDKTMVSGGLKIVVESGLHTDATKGKPIGWTAESDWESMIKVLEKYAGMKPKPAKAYYTNEFVASR
jgi:NitT/TauT family transport system substrate-binding protein